MALQLVVEQRSWTLREPFQIARGTQHTCETVQVTIIDADEHRGRGEAVGVGYKGEDSESLSADIERVRMDIERGPSRLDLQTILPAGGARFALDSAFWDLEAKRSGRSVYELAGIDNPQPVVTDFTIGIGSLLRYEQSAREHCSFNVLKVKVDATDPIAAVEAVRKGAPNSLLIVDPNQSWSIAMLREFAPRLHRLGVVLLEQPIAVGDEAGLDGYQCPIRLCADELVDDVADLSAAKGRFQVVNIKLDKSGGLTHALFLAKEAMTNGFELMVGCMPGSSLSIAPATVLGQCCAFADLDGPLLIADDWADGVKYSGDRIEILQPSFWG